tara:strand:+ start:15115 stop:15903 length:789 start_codon:yes stop_codon:yes gene_type:complete
MKRTVNKKLIISLLSMMLVLWGCAEQSKSSSNGSTGTGVDTTIPYVPPGSTDSDSPSAYWDDGASVDLVVSGSSDSAKVTRMSKYTGRAMNNPQDVRLNVNLEQYGDGWGGRISIAYYDNGQYYEGVFVAGDESYFPNTSLEEAAEYNIWYDFLGEDVFHGFFQDFQGGVIIVIDGYDDVETGDGQAPSQARGSVWFKNFDVDTFAPHPPTHCWKVSIGPYDCRAWEAGDGVNPRLHPEPASGYTKLGEFTGLDLDAAFYEE